MAKFKGSVNFGQAAQSLASAGQISAQSHALLMRGIENLGRGIETVGQGISDRKRNRQDQANRNRALSQRDRELTQRDRHRQTQETLGLISAQQRERDSIADEVDVSKQEFRRIQHELQVGEVDDARAAQLQEVGGQVKQRINMGLQKLDTANKALANKF